MDIHVMHPTAGGFDVGQMTHLWAAFLQNGVLPQHYIYPLRTCLWGGGIAYAPSKYADILDRWYNQEYGAIDTMWLPIEQHLATGDWFECGCELDAEDIYEIKESALRSCAPPKARDCWPNGGSILGPIFCCTNPKRCR